MAQLSIYNGSVTSGGTNGTLITTGDILKYTGEKGGEKGELGNVVPYALRAALTTNVYNVSLSIIGSNPEWLQISKDGNTWGQKLEFANIGDTNTLFYVRSNIPEGAEFGQTVLNRFLLKYVETVLTEG
jgi:hypothetical protein